MENKLFTAAEAREKALNYSDMENICSSIQASANRGLYRASFHLISETDLNELKKLGYYVHKTNDKLPFVVSWYPQEIMKDKLRNEIGESFIEWADNYFSTERTDAQLIDIIMYDSYLRHSLIDKRSITVSRFKSKLEMYKNWKTNQ